MVMASFIHFPTSKCITTFIFFLFSYVLISVVTGEKYDYVKTADPRSFGLKKEKLTHFRVYWQDIVAGSNPSGVTVVPPPISTSKSFFGMVRIIDNPLTTEVGLKSKMVGRAQGFYASASQEGFGLLMVMNFAFMEGKYNGSTISVYGRNAASKKVREMPVIGGSGLFRFARGYVEARTNMLNLTTGDATVEYNCYVLHY